MWLGVRLLFIEWDGGGLWHRFEGILAFYRLTSDCSLAVLCKATMVMYPLQESSL